MPERRALPARWQVAALGVAPRIAEARGQEGDAAGVVEGVPVDPEPGAQAVAARVVEGQPARMDLRAGSLADDQDACGRADARDRPRSARKVRGADTAARKSGGWGKGGEVGVDVGGRSTLKKKKKH